jgi:arylsulfatase A-like enzyme
MYGETPLCSPGRATLLTGQHTLHHGVTLNGSGVINPYRSVAWAMKRSGYHTSLVGKYFNYYTGGKPPGWSRADLFTHPGYLAERSADAIRNAPTSAPLFAWISTTAPHRCTLKKYPDADCRLPYVPERLRGAEECSGIGTFKPPSYRTWRTPKPFPRDMPYWPKGWPLQPTCESMLQVDEALAAIQAAQAERGRPAYYFLFSDNGMSWGQKGYPYKRVPTSTRIPMFAAGPRVPRGQSTGKLLSTIDFAPTIATLGGASMPWVDGAPFNKLLKGEAYDGHKRILEISLSPKVEWRAVRYKNWRYIKWVDGRRQLYNVRQDPWELKNLRYKKPALAKRLDVELKRMVKRSRS